MSIICFPCGCSIARSMFGEYEVMGVSHCITHGHLYSQHKTNFQMAQEIRDANEKQSELTTEDPQV